MKIGYRIRSKFLHRLFIIARRFVLRWWDPLVRIPIGERTIHGYLSTDYPLIARDFPHQDTALIRACQFLRDDPRTLTIIDVGANVGDTFTLLDQHLQASFLCVEGTAKFFALLEANTRDRANVTIHHAYLGDHTSREGVTAHVQDHGTCYLEEAPGSSRADPDSPTVELVTLDDLLQRYPAFRDARVLKVDTDGYDYKVLRGAAGLLAAAAPVILFELIAPYLLQAHENPLSVFPLLHRLGYPRAIFYDNTGYPMMELATDDLQHIDELICYSVISEKLYYDVLLFPGQRGQGFLDQERRHFPMRHGLVQGKMYHPSGTVDRVVSGPPADRRTA